MAKLIDLECLKAYNENIKKIFGEQSEQIDYIKSHLGMFYYKEYDLTSESSEGYDEIKSESKFFDAVVNMCHFNGDVTINVPKKSSYKVLVSIGKCYEDGIIIADKNKYSFLKTSETCEFQVHNVDKIQFNVNIDLWVDEIDVVEISGCPTRVSQLENDSKFVNSTVDNEILLLNIG